MALSNQVKESISQAAAHLREALAFAARSEHPICISTISDILIRLDSIESMEEMMQMLNPPGREGNVPFRRE